MDNEIKEKIYKLRAYLGTEENWLLNDIVDYITNLEEKINQYENPDDLTLFYMWLDEKAKDKMKELQTTVNNCKERIAYLERSNDRREDTIIGLRMDITDLEDIIYKLEKWLLLEISIHSDDDDIDTLYSCVLDKIKELKGEDKE